ncbi:hypothetical protein LXL04_001072 [Taraxacum kok-saghyz]
MQEEGKTDDGFGPLGICHRLYNFIIDIFVTRRVISPHEDKSRAHEDSNPNHDVISHHGHDTGPNILVEFRHTIGSIVNKRNNGYDQVLVQKNGNPTLTRRKTDAQEQRNGNGGQEKVPKKTNLMIIEGGNLPRRKPHILSRFVVCSVVAALSELPHQKTNFYWLVFQKFIPQILPKLFIICPKCLTGFVE